jgi:hypothetical protein
LIEVYQVGHDFNAISGHAIPLAMVPSRGTGIRHHEVIEEPLGMYALAMSRRDARRAAEPSQQHAKRVRSTHMGMQQLNTPLLDNGRDAPQFAGGPAAQIRFDNVNRVVGHLLSYPGTGPA